MSDSRTARLVALVAHAGQTDMAGLPYITHCDKVAELAEARYWDCGWDEIPYSDGYTIEDVRCVAYLHDVVEDTLVTLDVLREIGFNERVLAAVDAITQRALTDSRDGSVVREPLEEYWARVKANPLARFVKVYGDIPHNNDDARKAGLDPKFQEKLTDKYRRALEYLNG